MNWTGGRLHRHSKSNANPKVKAQREYFAKARLRSQNPDLIKQAPLTLSILGATVRPILGGHSGRSKPEGTGNLSENHRAAHDGTPPVIKHDDLELRATDRASFGRSRHFHKPSPSIPKPERSNSKPGGNTLQDVKHTLLERPDWTGLGITKPPVVAFPSQKDMESFGRRRRLPKVESWGKTERQLKTKRRESNGSQTLQRRRLHERVPIIHNETISLRAGSNIHQTQTTRENKSVQHISPRKSDSIASTSMILDRYEVQQRGQARSPRRTSPNYLVSDDSTDQSASVIPLNHVLDLKSFDEVIERCQSMSRSQQSSQYGNQYLDPKEPRIKAVADSSMQSSSSISRSQNSMWSTNNKTETKSHPQPEAAVRHEEDTYGAKPHFEHDTRIRVTPSTDSLYTRPVPRGRIYQPRGSSVSRQIFDNVPRFTLDEQVLLEKDDLRRGVKTDFTPLEPTTSHSVSIAGHASQSTMSRQGNLSIQDMLSRPLWRVEDELNDDRHFQECSENHLTHSIPRTSIAGTRGSHETRRGTIWSTASNSQFDLSDDNWADHSQNLRDRFLAAKQDYLLKNSSPPVAQHKKRPMSVSDENEEWMKYVFPQEFDRIQQGFSFASNQSPAKVLTFSKSQQPYLKRPRYHEPLKMSSDHLELWSTPPT